MINDYKKLGAMFVELEDLQQDIERIKKAFEGKEIEKFKVVLSISLKGDLKEAEEEFKLSQVAGARYMLDELVKRERVLREQIDRKLNRKWFEFWKYIK